MMRLLALLPVLLLLACARPGSEWARADTGLEQRQRDLDECRVLAQSGMRPEHEYEMTARCMRQRGYTQGSNAS